MARQYLTTKGILDQVFSRVSDNTSTLRVRMLAWYNSLAIQVANERPWNFLNTTVNIPIVNSVIPLPDDFGTETSITVGNIILTPQNLLNAPESFYWGQTSGILAGYTVDETGIALFPTTTGTAALEYSKRVPTYADDTTSTIFPTEFLPLLERSLLTAFYEYDVDSERMPMSFQLDAKMMSQVKKIDNQRKSLHRLNVHGYKRSAI
jgi:hypothetical protein